MHYSVISGLALILNLIINREPLKNLRGCFGERKDQQQMDSRYSLFLVISNCYFIADIAWGFLYGYHESNALFPILYVDTIFYFLFMFLTMLTWIRYIIAYLDKSGRRSRVFLHIVWGMFVIGLINLMINRFYPFIC